MVQEAQDTKDTKDGAVINVVIAGLGGQGILKASDILADAVFRAGYDVKKSEIHGMSQRGGSVTSDVRFGREVLSPMIPAGTADYLLVLAADQVENNLPLLKHDGTLLTAELIDAGALANRRSSNVALLGALSTYLDIGASCWHDAIQANLAAKLHEVNFQAWALGRQAAAQQR